MRENPNVFNEKYNNEVIARNKIAQELAVQYQLPYVDQFNFMFNNKKYFDYEDALHLKNRNGYVTLARELLADLVRLGVITKYTEIVK